MQERDVLCPAETRGAIGACRFCIYLPGGASHLCITKFEQYRRNNNGVDHAAQISQQVQEQVATTTEK